MAQVASRELRNNTRQVLDRVAAGEQLTITVSGVAVATLIPAAGRSRWIRSGALASLGEAQADAAMQSDLDALVGNETTDDLSDWG